MKKSILLLSLVLMLSNTSELYSQEQTHKKRVLKKAPKFTQRWGFSTAWLIQNAPFREFTSYQLDQLIYAQGINTWDMGDSATGFAFGFSYDLTAKNGVMFRMQGFIESTGWISGVFDIGTGIRIPMSLRNSFFSIEVYFSINQTGGTLTRIGTSLSPTKDEIPFYMGLFGFKSRMAFEFPIAKGKYFITPYVSYAVYPWFKTTTKADFFLNGFERGSLIDAIQIGIEFGSKF